MLGVRGEGRSPSSADDTAIDNDALILPTFTLTHTTHCRFVFHHLVSSTLAN